MTDVIARLDQKVLTLEREHDKLRMNVHELRNQVGELVVLYQEERDDTKELVTQQKAINEKLAKYITELALTAQAYQHHAAECLRYRIEDRKAQELHHAENQARLRRLETVYYLGLAVVALASFFGLGPHILTFLSR